MNAPLILLTREDEGAIARITLNRPERHNALVPQLLESLLEALDTFQTDLAELRRTIEVGDLERCRELIAEARTRRESQEEDPEE